MLVARNRERAFAVIIYISLLGIMVFGAVAGAKKSFVFWQKPSTIAHQMGLTGKA